MFLVCLCFSFFVLFIFLAHLFSPFLLVLLVPLLFSIFSFVPFFSFIFSQAAGVSHNDSREPKHAIWVVHGLKPRPQIHEKNPE